MWSCLSLNKIGFDVWLNWSLADPRALHPTWVAKSHLLFSLFCFQDSLSYCIESRTPLPLITMLLASNRSHIKQIFRCGQMSLTHDMREYYSNWLLICSSPSDSFLSNYLCVPCEAIFPVPSSVRFCMLQKNAGTVGKLGVLHTLSVALHTVSLHPAPLEQLS